MLAYLKKHPNPSLQDLSKKVDKTIKEILLLRDVIAQDVATKQAEHTKQEEIKKKTEIQKEAHSLLDQLNRVNPEYQYIFGHNENDPNTKDKYTLGVGRAR
jgi:hypothetical protein